MQFNMLDSLHTTVHDIMANGMHQLSQIPYPQLTLSAYLYIVKGRVGNVAETQFLSCLLS